MPSWVLTITDAEPPSAGVYKAMQRTSGGKVQTHKFRSTSRRAGADGFFVYAGSRAYDRMYPHVTVMLEARSVFLQRAGLLFFSSSEFHVSTSNSHKLFYEVANGVFCVSPGQGSVIGAEGMKEMGATFIKIVRRDLTAGITGRVVQAGRRDLAPEDSYGQPIWVREERERQELEQDQARLRRIVDRQNAEWASQFEIP